MIVYDEIKPSALEREMTAARKDAGQEVAVRKESPVQNPEIRPVQLEEGKLTLNTYEVLNIVKRTLANWARWPSEHALNIAALWVVSTWFVDDEGRLLFRIHPRLFFIAPPGSGKTRMMEIMQSLVHMPTGIMSSPMATAAFIRDSLATGHTVFLDEWDRQVGRGTGNQWVQALVSAYKDSASTGNARGGRNEQHVFGPMVIGGKPGLVNATNGLIEDLLQRAFVIIPVKHTSRNAQNRIPDLDEDFYESAQILSALLEIWGESVRPEPGKKLWPIHGIPSALDGRMREISMALLAVADRAVDPEWLTSPEHDYQDTRWAKEARESIQYMLLGRGNNGAELLADVKTRLKKLGIEV